MSTNCEAKKRLVILDLINVFVTNSPSLTDEVKLSSERIIKKIKFDLKEIASDKIICAMQVKNFGRDTEAHQAALGIYMIDKNLLTDVFNDVFKEFATEDTFKQIIELLDNFEDNGPIVYAYCSLFKYIFRLGEHLWSFEWAVSKLSKKPNFDPEELNKLKKLLVGIKEESLEVKTQMI